INEIGFGNDFGENKFLVTLQNLQLSTNWKKYIIPIPDPSKLTEERGMLWYSEGPEDGKGYTFWLDEIQFERVGDLTQPRSQILNGEDASIESFIGAGVPLSGLQKVVNLASGLDRTVSAAPAYFNFTSSDPSVATINDQGMVMVVGAGSTVITATLEGQDAQGSLTINSIGDFVFAPAPPQDPADVISIFSNAYDDIPVDYYNGFWGGSTTKGGNDLEVQGDNIISYTDLNFVGIQFSADVSTIDASEMTHLHVDLLTSEAIEEGDFIRVGLVDIGSDNSFGGGDDSGQELTFTAPTLKSQEWVSLDIPLTDFAGLINRKNLAQVVFVSDNTISALLVDNIYLYKTEVVAGPTEPEVAAPMPMQNSSDVISLFSDAYDDVTIDTWRTDWSASAFEDVDVDGNAAKKYSNLDFVGIEAVSNPIDASGMSHLHLDLWSSDFTFFGIKLVDFGPDGVFGGGDDSEHQINLEAPTQGEWLSLDLPLADFTGLTNRSSVAQFILVGQPSGATTIFVDNMYFYGEGMMMPLDAPSDAAPDPLQNAANVISLFSDAYDDVGVDTWRTDWSAATFEDVDVMGNPTKKYSDMDFVGIETVMNTIDASGMTNLRMDVWSGNFTFFGIKLVDFGADGAFGGGDDSEHQINLENLDLGQWINLDIPLSDFTGLTNSTSLGQMILVGQPTGMTTIYLDNIFFYGESAGPNLTEPNEPAPAPAVDANNVISLFSDVYADVPVDTWRTDWSAAGLEDIVVNGDSIKKYSGLDFVGIETVSNTVDASEMTHVHFDLWSADYTLVGLKIVDFGADGAFGGGDDSEHQINIENPMQGQWVSYDLALSDFMGLVNQGSLGQFILVAQPTAATTVYMDNFYFYKQ
ncbi:MAG: hypothetical protein KTR24_17905, partial [Saprospiraceae bacterium]|nr:hypothetical protein [Saprospiraceae bacterium]